MVVIDANVLIGICAKEKDKFVKARDALSDYAKAGWIFYALELWSVRFCMSSAGNCRMVH